MFTHLQAMGSRIVLVLTVENFRLDVVLERLVYIFLPFDIKLNVVVGLRSGGLVLNVLAVDVRDHFPLEELGNGSLDTSPLHFTLELVEEDPKEFLDVMLHERVQSLPPKGPRQLLSTHRLVRGLEFVEDSLESQGNAFG